MSATARGQLPLQRRRSQVFVEIPPSPVHTRRPDSRSPASAPHAVKENTPLRPSRMNSQLVMAAQNGGTSASAKKRKLVDTEATSDNEEPLADKVKKPRVAPKDKPAAEKKPQKAAPTKADEPTEEYPNGYFYCHQCNRKWDRALGIQCTLRTLTSRAADKRCRNRYCKACITNRYQKNMDELKASGIPELTKKERDQHLLTDGYCWECPACKDECNCRFCRKAKGLEPTGNLNLKARQAEKAAAAAAGLSANGQPKNGSKSASAGPSTKKAPTTKASKASKTQESDASKTKPRAKPKAKAVPAKAVPKPLWSRIATDLSHDEAQARLHIREFVLRFPEVLSIPHSHLDELEEISGDNLGEVGEWDVDTDSELEVISWVSDACAKAIIQGLLVTIAHAADAREEHGEAKAIREAVKAIKTSGSNLNRIWVTLLELREGLQPKPSLVFSDPLPPPAAATVRTTRSGMQSKDANTVYIATSAQLVPVIQDLIEASLESPDIRSALEEGATEEKELAKEVREALAKENSRWKDMKEVKDKSQMKALREQHNKTLRDLEFSHLVIAPRYIPRFAPLGYDTEGRTYYALTPGVGESDAAIQLIHGKNSKVKIGRKRALTEEDRQEMRRWSWFVAVWGKKPEGAEEAKRLDQDEDESDEESDEDAEAWWGFWQPAEVTKLADWLAAKNGVDATIAAHPLARKPRGRSSTASTGLSSREPSPLSDMSDEDDGERDVHYKTDANGNFVPVKRELQGLVKGLREFAHLLEWRIQRASGELTNVKEANGPVPASKFYAS